MVTSYVNHTGQFFQLAVCVSHSMITYLKIRNSEGTLSLGAFFIIEGYIS